MKRLQATLVAVLMMSVGLAAAPQSARAVPNPVATTDAEYLAYGRVFPDPHGCTNGAPGTSPFAKGNVCVAQFLHHDETIAGAEFLQRKHPRFLQVIRLDQAYDNPNYRSAGIPTAFGPDEDGDPQVLARDRRPLYLFKVTDAESPVPQADRLHFVYALSIHGIERAGLEGGVRAMEDLVTWAACEADPAAAPGCAAEGPFPKPIVETATVREVPTAGDVLRRSVIYFMLPNPDGWHRGEIGEGGVSYQRYNGNGVDLNRDWPTVGYTYRPYSPASEPEVKAFTEVLTQIRGTTSGNRFAGGIDLHGQLTANAFSFTLLGSGQRDFRKNFSTVDQSLRAWEDQTARLAWSPYIGTVFDVADQWGTVVDTIGYQITGGLGDWFESPIGLGAVGIDNEMSLSHLAPNTAYEPGLEQAHIDGNKGLIYSQLSSMLTEVDSDFVYDPPGKVGYIFDPERISHPGDDRSQNPGFPAQNDIDTLVPCTPGACDGGEFVMEGEAPTLEFDVHGPNRGIWNGGITVEATFTNAQGIGTGSLPNIELQRFETDHGDNEWETVARSYIQGGQPDLYLQSGQVVTANDPAPGRWRVRVTSTLGGPVRLEVDFNPVTAEADPGQAPFDVSNMDFFDDLNRYVRDSAERFEAITVDQVLADPGVLDEFDSVVAANDFMPGYVFPQEAVFSGEPQEDIQFGFGPEAAPAPQIGPDGTFEFDVAGPPDVDNDEMVVSATWDVPSDYDLYVEQLVGEQWISQGCECSFIANGEQVTVTAPQAGRWRVRLDNFVAAPQPVNGTIDFSADPPPPTPPPSQYTQEQFEDYSAALAGFASGGGNLVLTDRSLQGLVGLGLVPEGSIGSSQPGGRGPVPRYQFDIPGRGNLCTPDSTDPLVKDVCLPGTAGGTARQAVEPTPLGYSPDATEDGAPDAKLTQFFVDREAWESGCGKGNEEECTSGLFGEQAGLGERHLGRGVVRIAGAMLPDPNFNPGGPRDMRFGLNSYALTFSAWQIFLNLVDYQRPPPDLTVTDLTTVSKVRQGRIARITATIANQGSDGAAPSTTEFRLDGTEVLGNAATPAIPAGGSTQVSVEWDVSGQQGFHVIRATADVGNVIGEADEANNAGELTVFVQGNRVHNGPFEQANSSGTGPAGWSGQDTAAGQTSWSNDGRGGSRGAAITGTGGNVLVAGAPAWRSDPIDVVPGEVLDLVASARTSGISSAPGIGLAYLSATGQVLDTVRVLTAPLSTDGFVTLERSVTIPAGVAEVRVVLTGFAPTDTATSGTVVFDDVGLYAT